MFRNGPRACLVVEDVFGCKRLLTLNCPTMEALELGLLSLGVEAQKDVCFVVTRDDCEYAVRSDRDVEELGLLGKGAREILRLLKKDTSGLPGLEEYCPFRTSIPVIDTAREGAFVVRCESITENGRNMFESLRRNGYFRIVLDKRLQMHVEKTFDATESFFNLHDDEKATWSGTTSGRLAPFFGYRKVKSMSKELFVFRNTDLMPIPKYLEDLRASFDCLGKVLLECMTAMVPECKLGDCLGKVQDLTQLRHSSFMEVFLYESPLQDNSDRVKVACAEHRDTSLLTMVPNARGMPGLEGFDWAESCWRVLESKEHGNEAVVFAGELFCSMFPDTQMPALNHRVCVGGGRRVSCPVELLPEPTDEIRQMLSNLGKGLVSVNY